jgi:hypothetical protein
MKPKRREHSIVFRRKRPTKNKRRKRFRISQLNGLIYRDINKDLRRRVYCAFILSYIIKKI